MKIFTIFIVSLLLTLLASCSGSRQLEMTARGEEALSAGDYQAALELCTAAIGERESKGKQASPRMYCIAGISACELDEYARSLEYLVKAEKLGYTGEELYPYLARNYRHIDNLSREISALKAYLKNYPEGRESAALRDRLFKTCIESEDFGLAGSLWQSMDSIAREDTANLGTWLELNRMQGNDRKCDSIASHLLVLDRDNRKALEWLGKSFFWKAENAYQDQMKAYSEHRTRKQYAILLNAFKGVSADFRKSRDYFLRLYRLSPEPVYAGYLENIYTRLDDPEKASYYRKRAQ
jgi:hypothetical protein